MKKIMMQRGIVCSIMSIVFMLIMTTGCPRPEGDDKNGNGNIKICALNLDFETSTGGPWVSKGTANTGNFDISSIDGRNCLQVNGTTEDKYSSIGFEFQFDLVDENGTPASIDMTGQDFIAQFKYYLPSGGINPKVQYAIYESSAWTCMYSILVENLTTDSWTEIAIPINMENAGYNGFGSPDDWIVDKFRLQFISPTAGDTIFVYIDDLKVCTEGGEEPTPSPVPTATPTPNPYIEYSGLNGVARNPIISHVFTADPSAHVFDGRVYIVTSHDLDNQDNYLMTDYHVFSSDDLVNWQDHGVAISADSVSWATYLFAPDVAYSPHDGKYYLYFPSSGSGIGVAVSDYPYGPFTDALGHALITQSTPGVGDVEWVFDPMCFVDDDGQPYLYFGGGPQDTGDNARVIRLNDDMISLEDASATTIDATDYFEAPFMHKHNGKYYFSYSTTFAVHSASIDYMMSDNPMTGFVYQGTVLPNPGADNMYNNNHASICEFDGKSYVVYHNRVLALREGLTSYQRSITLDYMNYNPDDTIIQVTPTNPGTVTQVKNVDAFTTIQAEMMADQRGIEVDFTDGAKTSVAVTDIHDKEWAGYSRVDFGAGATMFYARVASGFADGGEIDIYIDGCDLFTNLSGTLVGTCTVSDTGGWETYADVSCAITETTGIHDIYLRFEGTALQELLRIDNFYFGN
jgi:arabinoxylan arabinofuranohydrolase